MTIERSRQLVRRVQSQLKRKYGRHKVNTQRTALEELLLGIISDGASERRAVSALNAISSSFVDWNEVRVSLPAEVAGAMPGIPDGLTKARVIREALREVYDRTSEMSLDFLKERGHRDALRLVAGIEGFPEPALARAIVIGLGQPVMPLTPSVLGVFRRLGLLNDETDLKALSRTVEKLVPKPGMLELHWLLARHAQKVCRPAEPTCAECCVRDDCRTGRTGSCSDHRPAARSEVKTQKSGKK